MKIFKMKREIAKPQYSPCAGVALRHVWEWPRRVAASNKVFRSGAFASDTL